MIRSQFICTILQIAQTGSFCEAVLWVARDWTPHARMLDYTALIDHLHPVNVLHSKRLLPARYDLIVGDWWFVPSAVIAQK